MESVLTHFFVDSNWLAYVMTLTVRHHYAVFRRPHCHWWQFAQAFVSLACCWLFLCAFCTVLFTLYKITAALGSKQLNQLESFLFLFLLMRGLGYRLTITFLQISTQRDVISNVNTIKSFHFSMFSWFASVGVRFCLHKLLRFSFFKPLAIGSFYF